MKPGELVVLRGFDGMRYHADEHLYVDQACMHLVARRAMKKGNAALILELSDSPHASSVKVLTSGGTIGWIYTYFLEALL